MTYKTGRLNSDSVNLGSNPSSPANTNADVSGVSIVSQPPERPERAEQTAHAGRTNVGTAARARYRAEIERLNRTTDREIDAAIRALEQRDPMGTIPLRSALKRLHRGTLLPSTRKLLMEFAAKDAERLAHPVGAVVAAPMISTGCSRASPETDCGSLQVTGRGAP